ncbi:MAG TPA: YIP1 family protein [Gemmatimonadaceae bacterium]|nr:YIP1 family protein [Gemmatimonadaceae bacterium]
MEDVSVAPQRASFAEDFIDIFYAPSSVFARRREANPWPTILVVTGLSVIAAYIMFTLLAPVVDAMLAKQMAMATQNQSLTPEQLQGARTFGRMMMLVSSVVGVPILVLVLGLVLWFVGKLLDAEQPLRAAFLVVAFSYMPRIVEQLLTALQAFWLDLASKSSLFQVSFSAARFADPEASQLTLGLLSRIDPFVLWSYVLIAIGLSVTGRISRGKAALGAFVLFLLGLVPSLVGGLMAAGRGG